MFATLLGALPEPDGASVDERIRTAVRAQEDAGLEPITDGRLRDPSFERLASALVARATGDGPSPADEVVAAWRFAAAVTDRAVKQALPGPYSVARRWAHDRPETAEDVTMRAATAIRDVVEALAAAGCPLVEIEEADAHRIGADETQRALFRDAHRRLSEDLAGTHLSLSIVGGSAWDAGLETVLAGSYASLAVDLIAGPDNWNLVTRLPGERGVIAGALPAKDSPADAKEMLLWAARHAAATRGRGLDRVGLGSAGSWANLTWAAAVTKMERLGQAARLAATPAGDQLAAQLDPRAVSARAAATGQVRTNGAARRDGRV